MTRSIPLSAALASIITLLLCNIGCTRPHAQAQCPCQTAQPPTLIPQPVFAQIAPPVATPPVLPGTPDIASLVQRIQPAVVNITTITSVTVPSMIDPFEFFFGPMTPGQPNGRPQTPSAPRTRESRSSGSGFVIDSNGYVVTNNHVIERADEIKVRFADERTYPAKIVGRDAKLDIALLKIDGAQTLSAAVLGDSDALRVGEYVIAMGNPFGLGHTVTMGIVSAKDRTIGAGPYDDFIQTDASINPGNSGGPLFNLRGELVGINTAVHAQGQGIGFAIPINMVRDAVVQLRDKGFVSRGKLGVSFQSNDDKSTETTSRQRGALIAVVEPGGAADRAGLKAGDLILQVEGTVLTQSTDLPRIIAKHAPGSTIRIQYTREGKQRTTSVTLDKWEDETKQPVIKPL